MTTRVYIMLGVSGSGKSTYAAQHFEGATVCSADKKFQTPKGYVFDPRLLPEAHGDSLRDFVKALQAPMATVIVDNTNTTVAEIAPYAALALAYGADLQLVHIACSVEIAAQRNAHGVPLAGVDAQGKRLADTLRQLPPWWPLVTVAAK